MGNLEAAVLAVLLRLPVCHADRDDPRKPEQLVTVARAIGTVAAASKYPKDKAAKLIAILRWESTACLAVHSGEHPGRGRGLYQLEGQGRRHKGPFVGLDYESTLNATHVASSVLDRSYQCGRTPRDVFTAYGARPCGSDWSTLSERVQTYQWAFWRLNK